MSQNEKKNKLNTFNHIYVKPHTFIFEMLKNSSHLFSSLLLQNRIQRLPKQFLRIFGWSWSAKNETIETI